MKRTLKLISGERIESPRSITTRPTTLMVREAVFSILGKNVEDSVWLDLFSGSGSIACEAYNHGAKKIIAIEKNRQNFELCKRNFISIQKRSLMEKEIEVICKDVLSCTKPKKKELIRTNIIELNKYKFDYIYLDPPYKFDYYDLLIEQIFKSNFIKKETLVIFEHSKSNNINSNNLWKIEDERIYGQTKLTFLVKIKHP